MKVRSKLLSGVLAVLAFFFLLGWVLRDQVYNDSELLASVIESAESKAALMEPVPSTTLSVEEKKSLSPPLTKCSDPYTLICDTAKGVVDPSGRVGVGFKGEILALRILRKIVRTHPQWTSEEVEAELVREIYTPERRQWVIEVFAKSRDLIRNFINKQPEAVFSKEEKDHLIATLNKVELDLPPPSTLYSDATDLFTKNDVFYQRNSKGRIYLRVGGAYLLNTSSEFNGLFTFAHELAHAIDPCESNFQGMKLKIYDPLIQCFIDQEWVPQERTHCEGDEMISEVFADWVATQVVMKEISSHREYSASQHRKATINAVKDLCEYNIAVDQLVFTHHPSPEIRIGKIFGTHPKTAQTLSCEPRPGAVKSYCQLQKLVPQPLKESP
ncbi:MAG: hypothetical protein KDD22_05560 [Bdellovibrionales bacterium]|nr:hypothetical protein [Bdellovibrionales bacterium]